MPEAPRPNSACHFVVSEAEAGLRLDRCLAARGLPLSRSQLKRHIEEGRCLVDGEAARPAHKLRVGQQVGLELPPPEPDQALVLDHGVGEPAGRRHRGGALDDERLQRHGLLLQGGVQFLGAEVAGAPGDPRELLARRGDRVRRLVRGARDEDLAARLEERVEAVELYDHQADPQENVNVAKAPANAALVARLMEQWREGWQGARRGL